MPGCRTYRVPSCQPWRGHRTRVWARASLLRLSSGQAAQAERPVHPSTRGPTDPLTRGGAGRARSAAAASAPAWGLAGGNGGQVPVLAPAASPVSPGAETRGWRSGPGCASAPAGRGGVRCGLRSRRGAPARPRGSQVALGVRARDCSGSVGARAGLPGDRGGALAERPGHRGSALAGLPGSLGGARAGLSGVRGCARGAPRWPRGDAGRAPLPLPPSSSPHRAQGAPPWRGSGTNPGKAALPAPSPPPAPPMKHLWCRGERGCGAVLLGLRMRFWLRDDETALEEMVRRLNAASKRAGRRSRWP